MRLAVLAAGRSRVHIMRNPGYVTLCGRLMPSTAIVAQERPDDAPDRPGWGARGTSVCQNCRRIA